MAGNAVAFPASGAVQPQNPQGITTSAAVMSNGLVIANVIGGMVTINNIISLCATANNATASTVQYATTPSGGSQATISGASASIANATAGATVDLTPTALGTAPTVTTNGVAAVGLGNGVTVPAGTLQIVVGVGSTTGTWRHIINFTPIDPGATVVPAF